MTEEVDLDQYRLDAAALAEIDRQIEAMPVLPEPQEMIAAMQAAPAGESLSIASAVKLQAMYRRCPAAEAQNELFKGLRSGDLPVRWPS
jgi:hypothetical protein